MCSVDSIVICTVYHNKA